MSVSDTLAEEIRRALNIHCAENASNTPDFILASYLISCLQAFNDAAISRDAWYGINPAPGGQR